jgi:hypothetical protein
LALKKDHSWLIANNDYTLNAQEKRTLDHLIEQRQPLPVPKSSKRQGFFLNKSSAMSIKSSVSGRGIRVSGLELALIKDHSWLIANNDYTLNAQEKRTLDHLINGK